MERKPVAQSNRDAEFAEFFEATWPRLLRTTYAVAGDRLLAEDALQTAFAKAYTSWGRVQDAQHPEAYVRRMAVNEVLSVVRRPWFRAERSTEATCDALNAELTPVSGPRAGNWRQLGVRW